MRERWELRAVARTLVVSSVFVCLALTFGHQSKVRVTLETVNLEGAELDVCGLGILDRLVAGVRADAPLGHDERRSLVAAARSAGAPDSLSVLRVTNRSREAIDVLVVMSVGRGPTMVGAPPIGSAGSVEPSQCLLTSAWVKGAPRARMPQLGERGLVPAGSECESLLVRAVPPGRWLVVEMAYLGVPRGVAVDAYVNGVRASVEGVKTVGGRLAPLVARAEVSGFAGILALLATLAAGIGLLFIMVSVGMDRLFAFLRSNPQA